MSFNINSIGPVVPPKRPATRSRGPQRSTPDSEVKDPAVRVDTIPATPPPEVHDAIAVAAQSYEQLHQSERHLSFHVDGRTGKLSVEVHDLQGNVLFTVPSKKALDIAAGDLLE